MRAIVFATGDAPNIDALTPGTPAPLLTLVDRPFIQHVVEALAAQGVTEMDVVLTAGADRFEALLNDGSAWGVTLRTHRVKDGHRPYGVLETLRFGAGETVVIAHADRLPELKAGQIAGLAAADGATAVFLAAVDAREAGSIIQWTGWAVVPADSLAAISAFMDERQAGEALLKAAAEVQVCMPSVLNVRSCGGLLLAQKAVLTGRFAGLLCGGSEVAPGVTAGHGALIDPSAIISGPCYIGANSRIGAGATLGPNSVVGANCMVDARSSLHHTLVMPGTYVGENLDLDGCIADRDCLVSARIGAVIPIKDPFLVSPLMNFARPVRPAGWIAQAVAAASAVFTLLGGAALLKFLSEG
jgi:mannose-1-phosphate guanylyltransferase/phosphomannomutase